MSAREQVPRFYVGQRVRLRAIFTDENGQLTDPTAVAIDYISVDPAGTIQSLSPTKEATGIYSASFIAASPGRYAYRGKGTGSVDASREAEFIVLPSAFD